MIAIRIDVTKISKERLYIGKSGKYLSCVLMENRQPDQYGNEYILVESVSKEERLGGMKGKIIGNGKNFAGEKRKAPVNLHAPASSQPPAEDDVPF